MNFLAHAYLSGSDENIIVGNFIADHVKGRASERYSNEIKAGIRLHRRIDAFTDSHPTVKESIKRLRGQFGKYSGVIADMFYDHFLAKQWNEYAEIPIRIFTANIYKIIERHFDILPAHTRRILPYMMADDWLSGYGSTEGLQMALSGMSRRTRFYSGMEHAVEALKKDYGLFRMEFMIFFEELQNDTNKFFDENGYYK